MAALIKMGAFVADISGKVGATIFPRNKGGSYAKNRVVPANPQSSFQANVRSLFTAITQAWSGLTSNQRTGWNSAVGDFPYQNRLGETKTLSGKALFQKLNENLLNVGESVIDDAPSPVSVPSVTGSN